MEVGKMGDGGWGGGRVSKGRMGTSVASIDVDPDQFEKLEGQLEKVSEWVLI